MKVTLHCQADPIDYILLKGLCKVYKCKYSEFLKAGLQYVYLAHINNTLVITKHSNKQFRRRKYHARTKRNSSKRSTGKATGD